jgi:hypothetical protein
LNCIKNSKDLEISDFLEDGEFDRSNCLGQFFN